MFSFHSLWCEESFDGSFYLVSLVWSTSGVVCRPRSNNDDGPLFTSSGPGDTCLDRS